MERGLICLFCVFYFVVIVLVKVWVGIIIGVFVGVFKGWLFSLIVKCFFVFVIVVDF